MPASINDKFTETTNGGRPIPTELQVQKSIGAAQITVGSTGGWAVATAVHFIMYKKDGSGNKIDGTQTDWKGIVIDASTIGSLQLKAGTDDIYPIGSVIVAAPTAAWADDVVEGLAVSLNQDGTMKPTAVKTALGNDGNLVQTVDEMFSDTVTSGGLWTILTGRNASMTSGVAYINGIRITFPAVASRTFTASKDTYVSVNGVGTLAYQEVVVGAAQPTVGAGYVFIAKITTDASNITASGIALLSRGAVNLNNMQAGTTELGFSANTRNSVIPASWTTYETITAYSTGGKVFCHGIAGLQDGSSGGDRTGYMRLTCDGVAIPNSEQRWKTYGSASPNAAPCTTMAESTPTPGIHTWTLDVIAGAASATLIGTTQFRVQEVK